MKLASTPPEKQRKAPMGPYQTLTSCRGNLFKGRGFTACSWVRRSFTGWCLPADLLQDKPEYGRCASWQPFHARCLIGLIGACCCTGSFCQSICPATLSQLSLASAHGRGKHGGYVALPFHVKGISVSEDIQTMLQSC